MVISLEEVTLWRKWEQCIFRVTPFRKELWSSPGEWEARRWLPIRGTLPADTCARSLVAKPLLDLQELYHERGSNGGDMGGRRLSSHPREGMAWFALRRAQGCCGFSLVCVGHSQVKLLQTELSVAVSLRLAWSEQRHNCLCLVLKSSGRCFEPCAALLGLWTVATRC